jgi:hypothetical protein
MKILIDDKVVLELSDTQINVFRDEIPDGQLQDELEFRIRHALMDKYAGIYKRMETFWIPQLKEAGVTSIPLDEEKFAQLVFSQPKYTTRSQREAGAKAFVAARQTQK